MLPLILRILFLIVPFVIYIDATNHNIGRVKGEKGFLNIPAGGWAFCSWGIWMIALPAYLICRNKLIAKAQSHPVVLSTAHKVCIILLLIALEAGSLYLPKLNSHLDSDIGKLDCEADMTAFAKYHGADPAQYIATNQPYLQKCIVEHRKAGHRY